MIIIISHSYPLSNMPCSHTKIKARGATAGRRDWYVHPSTSTTLANLSVCLCGIKQKSILGGVHIMSVVSVRLLMLQAKGVNAAQPKGTRK